MKDPCPCLVGKEKKHKYIETTEEKIKNDSWIKNVLCSGPECQENKGEEQNGIISSESLKINVKKSDQDGCRSAVVTVIAGNCRVLSMCQALGRALYIGLAP